MDQTIPALRRAAQHAETFLNGLDERSVATTMSVETLRERLGVALTQGGVDPEQIIDELVAATEGGLLGSASGRFYAWVIGGGMPASLAADWLTAAWDQNAAVSACSPAMAVIEEVAGEWLRDILELPAEASFALTTGCQMAHVTALAAARFAVLKAAGWDVHEAGLFGAPPVRVLTTEARHGTVDRAVRLLGFGLQNRIDVATDADGCVDPHALEAALAAFDGPAIVVLDAADLNIGAFDAFATLIPIAKSAGAWVHVDGAFGLFARASRAKRHLLDGVESADSWATDAHKWLNVPYDCGIVFVRDAAAHRAAMTASSSYVPASGELRDQMDWTPDWSRRGRGVALYAALRELGRAGLEDLIDRTCAHAAAIVSGIGALDGAEVLWPPHLNQGLLRFPDPRPDATAADHDARTDRVMAAINATGEAFFSGTTWRNKRAMRVSVVNWRTTDRDVQRTITAAEEVLRSI